MSSTVVLVADWIKRIADDERRRDATRVREDEAAARKAELVRRNGRRLIDELCAAVVRDVDAFRSEFAGDPARAIVVDATAPGGGFTVRKPASAAVLLTVTPNLDAAFTVCTYRFTVTDGMPPREDRIDILFADNATDTLQMKHRGTGQVFGTADALSEFLLVPVLTGRPR
jgi:hypothetical protein